MDSNGSKPDEGEESGPKNKKGPVFILTPQGTLKEITDQTDMLRSLLEKYKVEGDSFKELIQKEIEDLKMQLMDEMDESQSQSD